MRGRTGSGACCVKNAAYSGGLPGVFARNPRLFPLPGNGLDAAVVNVLGGRRVPGIVLRRTYG